MTIKFRVEHLQPNSRTPLRLTAVPGEREFPRNLLGVVMPGEAVELVLDKGSRLMISEGEPLRDQPAIPPAGGVA